jgi:hypothetical protein
VKEIKINKVFIFLSYFQTRNYFLPANAFHNLKPRILMEYKTQNRVSHSHPWLAINRRFKFHINIKVEAVPVYKRNFVVACRGSGDKVHTFYTLPRLLSVLRPGKGIWRIKRLERWMQPIRNRPKYSFITHNFVFEEAIKWMGMWRAGYGGENKLIEEFG